jgi:hypothetical protein
MRSKEGDSRKVDSDKEGGEREANGSRIGDVEAVQSLKKIDDLRTSDPF